MRPIGGELECKSSPYKAYFTDSGRSSLRLFLRSYNNRLKKYLIPNFFCEIIEDVFKEESIEYEFYNILENLTIDTESIVNKNYDVFYIINYFGKEIDISILKLDDKILLEDNVFSYDFYNHNNAKYWYAFNSFRKITDVADGSLVKTNLAIEESLIFSMESPFVKIKYKAKDIKYNYIYNNKFIESDYLDKFVEAEILLNRQKNIYKMSYNSQEKLMRYNSFQTIAKERYELLLKLFSDNSIDIQPTYYSFFILYLKNRNEFRTKMMKKNIFLAIHWSKSSQKNILYNNVISIPLFAHYSNEEFNYLIKSIKELI